MNKPRNIIIRTASIAAVLTFCIMCITMTPLANPIKGFFKDIMRFDGAITGTRYENATNDIKINALELTSQNKKVIVPLEISFKNATVAPFSYIQEVVIPEFRIIDSNNKEIFKSKLSAKNEEKGIVSNGKTLVNVFINDEYITSGQEYTIEIKELYGLSKADAALHINGIWECTFVK